MIVKYTLNAFDSHEDRVKAIQEKKTAQLEKAKQAKVKKTQKIKD